MSKNFDVAIIGMGCKFPGGSNSVKEFWNNIKSGKDCVTEVPENRWSIEEYYHNDDSVEGKTHSRWGGFIDDFDKFDAPFFGINEREARQIDPQQRQMLEVTWETFENAGMKPCDYRHSKTGVFVGGFTLDYKIMQFADVKEVSTHTAVGSMMTMLSNRISYIYDFQGPSMSIDTACSSSLVSVHVACMSLKNNECDMALAGGVEMIFAPEYYIAESKGGFLSKDGRCKTFDAGANGYVRSEGIGAVLLKPLDKAVADGNKIYAVIRGSLVNQDGKTSGITVPSQESQENLLREVYKRAGIDPRTVPYVELHGTGTEIGDPIEANAVGAVFGEGRENDPLIVSSVKANIGHMEAASGMASLIKGVCILNEKTIAPQIGVKNLNPKIDVGKLHIRIPEKIEKFPETDGSAIIGVNSFGFGGTNAHVILQEYAHSENAGCEVREAENYQLLGISAKSEDALKSLAAKYKEYLQSTDESVADICYAAASEREKMPLGLAVTGKNRDDFVKKLDCYLSGEVLQDYSTGENTDNNKIVFVYTGMGPQWYAMGRELYHENPVFHRWIHKLDGVFSKYLDWSILDEFLVDEENSRMERTDVSQPMNFVIQVALTEMWKSMGVVPDAIIGHSVGEVAAFYEAGVYTLDEAARISFVRSKCQYKLTGKGTMLAVGLSEEDVKPYLTGMEDKVSIGAINSHTSVTLSGNRECLEKIAAQVEEKGVFNRFLKVSIPFHSILMREIKNELFEGLGTLNPMHTKVELYTTAEGKYSDGTDLDANYWWKNVSNPVHFADTISLILDNNYVNFVEIGPHPVLGRSISEVADEKKIKILSLPTIRRKEPETRCVCHSWGNLYCAGCHIDMDMIYGGTMKHIDLPHYSWDHKRYWKEAESHMKRRLGKKDHVLLGYRQNLPTLTWKAEINDYILPYVKDHCVNGHTLIAGAHYIETAIQVENQCKGGEYKLPFSLYDVNFNKALFLNESNTINLIIQYIKNNGTVQIFEDDKNYEYSSPNFTARLIRKQEKINNSIIDLNSIKESKHTDINGEDCYSFFTKLGFSYGPMFHVIKEAYAGDTFVLGKLHAAEELDTEDRNFVIHPVILDGAFQTMILNQLNESEKDSTKLPTSIDCIKIYRPVSGQVYAYATVIDNTDEMIRGNISIINEDGKILAEIIGFTARVIENDEEDSRLSEKELCDWFYRIEWQKRDRSEDEELFSKEEAIKDWIIFGDDGKYADEIAGKLKSQDCNCIFAADNGEDILSSLSPDKRYGVLFLRSLDISVRNEEMCTQEIEKAKTILLNPVRNIMNSFTEKNLNFRMWVVTKNAVSVLDDDIINLNQAPIIGMGRVLGQSECIANWGGCIDLDENEDSIELLVKDLTDYSRESEIAYRNAERYTSRLVHRRNLSDGIPLTLDSEKLYIVSGALGSLGQITCRWMLEKGARHFLLLGRSIPVDDGSNGTKRLRFIHSLEAEGAEVQVRSANVKDESDIAKVAEEVHNGIIPVGGIFHIAGVIRDQLLMQMTQEEFDDVYDPKAMGAWNLSKYFWNDDLDFFLTYSSTGAVVTSVGQANYAAGNAFMDALAFYRRKNGRVGQSIGWGPWAVGMVKEKNLIDHYKYVRGMAPIYPKAGMQALERILGQEETHIVLCGSDWPLAIESYPGRPTLFNYLAVEMEQNKNKGTEIDYIELLNNTEDGETKRGILSDGFTSIVSEIIYTPVDEINRSAGINTIGVDSIIATEIRNKVNQRFGIAIKIADILGGFSINNMVEEGMKQLDEQNSEDERELEKLLNNLDSMSDEEAEKLLQQSIMENENDNK